MGQSRHGDCLTVERASNTSLQFYGPWGHVGRRWGKARTRKILGSGSEWEKCLQGVFLFFFFKSWLHTESSAEARPQIKRPKIEGGGRGHKYSKNMTGQRASVLGCNSLYVPERIARALRTSGQRRQPLQESIYDCPGSGLKNHTQVFKHKLDSSEIIAENVPHFLKSFSLRIQETQSATARLKTKNTTPRHRHTLFYFSSFY